MEEGLIQKILGSLPTVNRISFRLSISVVLLITAPFLLYVFMLFSNDSTINVFGHSIELGYFSSIKVLVWTLMQKLVPVIAIIGIFFLFPAIKNEKFISVYWLVFPLFSIYMYQTVWIFIDMKGIDMYFTELSIWVIIILSIFSLALFRKFLIEKERVFVIKLENIRGVLQQLRDEEIFRLFSNLYSIDIATGRKSNNTPTDIKVLRERINDYALDGMKNINIIFELLDKQKEELNEIDSQSLSQADYAF